MRLAALVILLFCIACSVAAALADPPPADASGDNGRSQVAAARADAIQRLAREIEDASVLPNLTAGELVDRTGGEEALRRTLRAAEQIGGARWIDEQTTQVRLEIGGDDVARTLVDLAAAHPKSVPVPVEALRERLAPWKTRTFAAIGTSTGQAAVDRLRPSVNDPAWAGVSERDRRAAVDAAKLNAVSRVVDSVSPIELGDGKTIGDALSSGPASRAVRDWLASRSVTSAEFRDDLEVRLALAAPPEEFWRVLSDSLEHRQTQVPFPATGAARDRVHQQVVDRMAPAIGRSIAAAGPQAVPTRPAVLLPAEPPRWVDDTMDAEGVAHSTGRLLRTARAAESMADDRLRARLETLPLSAGLTLGEAARRDPRIADAIARGIAHARPYKVDYDYPDRGAVRVRVSVNLEDVWRELTAR